MGTERTSPHGGEGSVTLPLNRSEILCVVQGEVESPDLNVEWPRLLGGCGEAPGSLMFAQRCPGEVCMMGDFLHHTPWGSMAIISHSCPQGSTFLPETVLTVH